MSDLQRHAQKGGVDIHDGLYDFVSVNPAWNGSPLLPGYRVGTGKTFFVHRTNGSNAAGYGTTPSAPYSTLTYALAQCVADRGDTIVKLPGASLQEATAVTCNKAGVTIIGGLGTGNDAEPEKHLMYCTTTAGPCIDVTAPTCFIGLEFWTLKTTGGAVEIEGEGGGYAGGFCSFYNCRFVKWGTVPNGLVFNAGAYARVVDCSFDGLDIGIEFGSTVSNNPTNNEVIGCRFKDCTAGIKHKAGATPHNFIYKGNIFVDCTDSIHFNNIAADGLVCDNYYETATDAATYDITVAAAQVHGVNFSGNHYSE